MGGPHKAGDREGKWQRRQKKLTISRGPKVHIFYYFLGAWRYSIYFFKFGLFKNTYPDANLHFGIFWLYTSGILISLAGSGFFHGEKKGQESLNLKKEIYWPFFHKT